jgi:peptidoglycan/LPS O-acetylase OafA/YrhL
VKHISHHSEKQSSNYADPLLILRGIACLMVVASHCNPPRHSIIYQNYDFSWLIFAPGNMSVWIFFCLSGYLIGKAFYLERYQISPSGVLSFWRNRCVRILPLYSFAILILSLFVYPDIFKPENWSYFIRLFTFTYQPFLKLDTNSSFFNITFWSLSTEVQFYLIAPFLYSLLSLVSTRRICIFLMAVFFTVALIKFFTLMAFSKQILNNMSYAITYLYVPLYANLDIFLCGFTVNALIKHRLTNRNIQAGNIAEITSRKIHYSWLKYISIILIFLLYLYCQHHSYHQELTGLATRPGGFRTSTFIFILQPLTAIVTSIFIYAFEIDNYYSHTKNKKLSLKAILNNPVRFLEILGILSYGIYLWHVPILDRVTPIFTFTIPIEAFLSRLTGATILSIVLSTCTYFLVELPPVKWKSRSTS